MRQRMVSLSCHPRHDNLAMGGYLSPQRFLMGVRLLAVHHLRNGREQLAAGFLVFLAGETLMSRAPR
jgi:hypothetical protein